jgi:hypothetical protein
VGGEVQSRRGTRTVRAVPEYANPARPPASTSGRDGARRSIAAVLSESVLLVPAGEPLMLDLR